MSNTRNDLEYYLGRKPTADEVAECDEWLEFNVGADISDWVSAMREIGAL